MIKNSLKYLILICIVILAECSEEKDKLTKKKIKIEKFMRDLHGANNVYDLMSYDLKFKQLSRPRVKVAAVMGRGSFNAPSAIKQEEDTIDATPGKCDPKPVCISNPLTLNITSTQFAFPPCINIHRCDGCCPTNEKCVAIGEHEVKLQKVGIINFDGENQPVYDETSVSVLNHTDCQCQCQWRSDEDCKAMNPNLIRNPHACECTCPEELYCDPFHQFDQDSCSCKCLKEVFGRLEKNCELRGFNWNDEKCKCEPVRKRVYSRSVRLVKLG